MYYHHGQPRWATPYKDNTVPCYPQEAPYVHQGVVYDAGNQYYWPWYSRWGRMLQGLPGYAKKRMRRESQQSMCERESSSGCSVNIVGLLIACVLILGAAAAAATYLSMMEDPPVTITKISATKGTVEATVRYDDRQFTASLANPGNVAYKLLEEQVCNSWGLAYMKMNQKVEECSLTSVMPGSVVVNVTMDITVLVTDGPADRLTDPCSQVFTRNTFSAATTCVASEVVAEVIDTYYSSSDGTQVDVCRNLADVCGGYDICETVEVKLDDGLSHYMAKCDCFTGYLWASGTGCVASCDQDNCQKCEVPDKCAECDRDYSPDREGVCLPSCEVMNCSRCDVPDTCAECDRGYLLDNTGGCQPSCEVDDCTFCDMPDLCSECLPGYMLNATGHCLPNCSVSNCEVCHAPHMCSVCDDHYHGNDVGGCDPSCDVDFCTSCTTPDNCSRCDAGYILDTMTGVCNASCNVSDCRECQFPDVCAVCDEDYKSDGMGNCQPCCEVEFCVNCSVPGVCAECEEGYDVSRGGCQASCRVSNCDVCHAPDVCSICSEGYYGNNGTCEPSCDVDNCATCNRPDYCRVCDTGYNLRYGNCSAECNVDFCESCVLPNHCHECKPNYYDFYKDGTCHTECLGECGCFYEDVLETPTELSVDEKNYTLSLVSSIPMYGGSISDIRLIGKNVIYSPSTDWYTELQDQFPMTDGSVTYRESTSKVDLRHAEEAVDLYIGKYGGCSFKPTWTFILKLEDVHTSAAFNHSGVLTAELIIAASSYRSYVITKYHDIPAIPYAMEFVVYPEFTYDITDGTESNVDCPGVFVVDSKTTPCYITWQDSGASGISTTLNVTSMQVHNFTTGDVPIGYNNSIYGVEIIGGLIELKMASGQGGIQVYNGTITVANETLSYRESQLTRDLTYVQAQVKRGRCVSFNPTMVFVWHIEELSFDNGDTLSAKLMLTTDGDQTYLLFIYEKDNLPANLAIEFGYDYDSSSDSISVEEYDTIESSVHDGDQWKMCPGTRVYKLTV